VHSQRHLGWLLFTRGRCLCLVIHGASDSRCFSMMGSSSPSTWRQQGTTQQEMQDRRLHAWRKCWKILPVCGSVAPVRNSCSPAVAIRAHNKVQHMIVFRGVPLRQSGNLESWIVAVMKCNLGRRWYEVCRHTPGQAIFFGVNISCFRTSFMLQAQHHSDTLLCKFGHAFQITEVTQYS